MILNLLDGLNDKSLALAHQRKANKLLASKITDLEQRLIGNSDKRITKSIMSPSVILLSGYAASRVDDDLHYRRYDDDPITLSPAASSSMVRSEGLSSESNHPSENSSEYELGIEMTKPTVRHEFADLPPDLAAMVQKSMSQ